MVHETKHRKKLCQSKTMEKLIKNEFCLCICVHPICVPEASKNILAILCIRIFKKKKKNLLLNDFFLSR